jgi:Flp pilus assembly protein TadB
MTLAPFDPKPSLDKELIQIYRERRRQAGVSFNLSLVIIAASAIVAVVGTIQAWNGHIQGNITAAAGLSASALCLRFAKDANDRLDKLAAELKDE